MGAADRQRGRRAGSSTAAATPLLVRKAVSAQHAALNVRAVRFDVGRVVLRRASVVAHGREHVASIVVISPATFPLVYSKRSVIGVGSLVRAVCRPLATQAGQGTGTAEPARQPVEETDCHERISRTWSAQGEVEAPKSPEPDLRRHDASLRRRGARLCIEKPCRHGHHLAGCAAAPLFRLPRHALGCPQARGGDLTARSWRRSSRRRKVSDQATF